MPRSMRLALGLLAASITTASAQIITDYGAMERLVCAVIHNALPTGAPTASLCDKYAFMRDPTLSKAVEEEKVLFEYDQVVGGCTEYARRGACVSGNDVCDAMDRQANQSGTRDELRLFHAAAHRWKTGTDTYSGAAHNCHAYGLAGPATALPPSIPAFPNQIEQAQAVVAAVSEACEADHPTPSLLRCPEPEHMCHQCVKVASADISQSGAGACPDGDPLCALFEARIPAGLPRSLSAYYRQRTLTGYTAGLARLTCMDFNACVDAPWMATAGASNAVANFMAEIEAYGSSFADDLKLIGSLPRAQWEQEARMYLAADWMAKARSVAQASTALTFGLAGMPDAARRQRWADRAQEAAIAVAMGMERDLGAVSTSTLCGVVCGDAVQALIFGSERMTDPAGNKTMSLQEIHQQLAPFAKFAASDRQKEVVEELVLLVSLTFEDYALSLEAGEEPGQAAFSYMVAMTVAMPPTIFELLALGV